MDLSNYAGPNPLDILEVEYRSAELLIKMDQVPKAIDKLQSLLRKTESLESSAKYLYVTILVKLAYIHLVRAHFSFLPFFFQ